MYVKFGDSMKKVELLAPVGNMNALKAAVMAGCDAVYLGGIKFGARAFSKNFDNEEIIEAINYCHLYGVKVYVTVNTLIYENEVNTFIDYIEFLHRNNVDAVIIQDFGMFDLVRKTFPNLELHASTQMHIHNLDGTLLMEKLGMKRVVLARETSIDQIREIKNNSNVELEVFVHGALCISYSGQCLMSSLIGGRSGNRGKCAQSCRLPYQVNLAGKDSNNQKKEEYPLSLKDMCSIELVPELIKAGIDSFKIEGRMKRPEYVAGVTAIYRKYIDLCYQNGLQSIKVEKKDWEALKSLYIRTDIQDGYYKRHNGKEMVTIHKPSYSGIDEGYAASIYEKYVKNPLKAEVCGFVNLKKGQAASLQLMFKDFVVYCEGDLVDIAQKRPVVREDVEKQLKKTGNTDFVFSALEIEMDEDIFIPLKSLNELRRQAFEELEKLIKQTIEEERKGSLIVKDTIDCASQKTKTVNAKKKLHIFVSTYEQCKMALENEGTNRIYVSGDLLLDKNSNLVQYLQASDKEIWIKTSEVLREKDYPKLEKLIHLSKDFAKGMLISNLETYSYLKYHNYTGEIALNYHVYVWNQDALDFWNEKIDSFLMPVELNVHEWKQLQNEKAEYLCYGKVPMMVTSNCIRKTKDACRGMGVSFDDSITDRYKTNFNVQSNCNYCYNVIYNSVPHSLHQNLNQILGLEGRALRLDFTTESAKETKQILEAYAEYLDNQKADFSFVKEYTTGHYKKGAL